METIITIFGNFVWDKDYRYFECTKSKHPHLLHLDLPIIISDVDDDIERLWNNKTSIIQQIESFLLCFITKETDGKCYIRSAVEDQLYDMSYDWALDWDDPREGNLSKEDLIDLENLASLSFVWEGHLLDSIHLTLWEETDLWADHFITFQLDKNMNYIKGTVTV